jgi:hypothetical protein
LFISLFIYPASVSEGTNRSVDFVSVGQDGQYIEYNKTAGAFHGRSGYIHNGKGIVDIIYSPTLKKIATLGSDEVLNIQDSAEITETSTTAPVVKAVEIKQPRCAALFPCGKMAVVCSLKKISIVSLEQAAVHTSLDITFIYFTLTL